MLEDFVVAHRHEIINRCRAKVAVRSAPPPTPAEINYGLPMFLDHLITELRIGLSNKRDIAMIAAKHGRELLVQGFTPTQAVHDYSDICQAIAEMTNEKRAAISSDDFRLLNCCLDEAIAAALTEYVLEREAFAHERARREGDRASVLGEGLRVSLVAANVAFEAIQSGKVGFAGSTGMVLERSLKGAEDMNDRLQQVIGDFRRASPAEYRPA
jgi:hypothetical protein